MFENIENIILEELKSRIDCLQISESKKQTNLDLTSPKKLSP